MISFFIKYKISSPLVNVIRDAEIFVSWSQLFFNSFKSLFTNTLEQKDSLVSSENLLMVYKPWLLFTNKKELSIGDNLAPILVKQIEFPSSSK